LLFPPLLTGLTYHSVDAVVLAVVITLFVAGLAAPLAVLIILTISRRSKWSRSECPRCGYDLTGNRSGGCPECGRLLDA
jgi:hypothetical protein